jgi:hypothetical protein
MWENANGSIAGGQRSPLRQKGRVPGASAQDPFISRNAGRLTGADVLVPVTGRYRHETVRIAAGITPGIRIAEYLPKRADAVSAGGTIVAVTRLSRRNRAGGTKRESGKKRDQSFPVHVKSP